MTPRRKPNIAAEEARRMAACQAEGQRAKEKALLLVLGEVVKTMNLSDETRRLITNLMARVMGRDVRHIRCPKLFFGVAHRPKQ